MLSKMEEWILIVSLVAMALLGGYQVATRYVFTSLALVWIEELIRHLFIIVTYIGAAAVMRKKGHPAVEALAQILPGSLKPYHDIYTYICAMLFAGVAAYASWHVIIKQKVIGIETVATEIPMYIVSIPLFVGFLLIFFHAAVYLVGEIKKIKQ